MVLCGRYIVLEKIQLLLPHYYIRPLHVATTYIDLNRGCNSSDLTTSNVTFHKIDLSIENGDTS